MNWIIRPYQPDDAAWLLSAEMAIQMHEITIHDPRLAQSRLPGSETNTRDYLDMLWDVLDRGQGAMLIAEGPDGTRDRPDPPQDQCAGSQRDRARRL